MRGAVSLRNALAACASVNSAVGSAAPASMSEAARASVARQAPSSIAFSATSATARGAGWSRRATRRRGRLRRGLGDAE